MKPVIAVRLADPRAPESLALIQKLWRELDALYPEVDGAPFQTHDLAHERSGFVIAWVDERPSGCGAFRPLPAGDPETAEIKMYVEPEARRRGVSRLILRKLEELAPAAVTKASDWKPACGSRMLFAFTKRPVTRALHRTAIMPAIR